MNTGKDTDAVPIFQNEDNSLGKKMWKQNN